MTDRDPAADRNLVRKFLQLYAIQVAEPGAEYTLSSGEKTRYYCDAKRTLLHRRVHVPLACLLVGEIERTFAPISAVAGVVLGGCHLASITAMYASFKHDLQWDVIHVRKQVKDHGTKNLVERPLMTEWQQVVLLEDVVTTGESSLRAAELLRKERLDVVGVLAIVDRRKERKGFLGSQYKFSSLFQFEELIGDG